MKYTVHYILNDVTWEYQSINKREKNDNFFFNFIYQITFQHRVCALMMKKKENTPKFSFFFFFTFK